MMVFLAKNYISVSYLPQWAFQVSWSLALCTLIFVCISGSGSVVDWFLSLPQWQPLSRLSFITFLFHVMVFMAINVNVKTGLYFSKFALVSADFRF